MDIKRLLLFLAFSVQVVQAQVLDTISLKEFKTLKYKQVKALYAADEHGLNLVKKSHTRKINSYVFFGLSVPFAVTLNPTFIFPLGIASIKLSNNTKRSLYNKLKYYERVKYNMDTIKMVIPEDTNSYKYKYANYEFDVTLDEFKALGLEKQKAMFNINDTTQFIFDYSNTFKYNTEYTYIACTLLFALSSYFFYEGRTAFIDKGEMYFIPVTFFVASGIGFSSLGIYAFPGKKQKNKMDMNRILYTNIQQYYLTHKVYPVVARFIKNRREHHKPKPFLN